ncbi:MAG: hypothetical protein ACE5OR_01665 [bacterium]
MRIWDIKDLGDISQVAEYITDPTISVHNSFVKGNYAYIAYYMDWLRILDISDPANPVEVGVYDKNINNDGGLYSDVWAVYPYSPSGVVHISCMYPPNSGFYTLQFAFIKTVNIKHDPLGDTEETVGPYPVTATIFLGPGNQLDGSSPQLVYGTNGVFTDSLPMETSGNLDAYAAGIPWSGGEADVTYYISATDTSGRRVTHPAEGPEVYHTFHVGPDLVPPVIVSVDFSFGRSPCIYRSSLLVWCRG